MNGAMLVDQGCLRQGGRANGLADGCSGPPTFASPIGVIEQAGGAIGVPKEMQLADKCH